MCTLNDNYLPGVSHSTCLVCLNGGVLEGYVSPQCQCLYLDEIDLLEAEGYRNVGQCIANFEGFYYEE